MSGNNISIFGIPVKADLAEESFDSLEIDEIRNHFVNNVDGIELFSILRLDVWEFRFSGTPYFFRIPSNGTFTKIIFFNDVSGKKFSVEELLNSKHVPDSVKKIVTWNIDIFGKVFQRKNFGWTITENIGIGIVNPKGLANLNVKKNK